MTTAVKARLIHGARAPDAMLAKPARKSTPVASEKVAHPHSLSAGEAAGKDESRADQPDEADAARHEVQGAVPAHRRGRPGGRSGRKAIHRVGDEDAGADEPQAIQRQEYRPPRAGAARVQALPHADCAPR